MVHGRFRSEGRDCLPSSHQQSKETDSEAEHVDKIACKQTTDAKHGTQLKLTNLTRRTGPARCIHRSWCSARPAVVGAVLGAPARAVLTRHPARLHACADTCKGACHRFSTCEKLPAATPPLRKPRFLSALTFSNLTMPTFVLPQVAQLSKNGHLDDF